MVRVIPNLTAGPLVLFLSKACPDSRREQPMPLKPDASLHNIPRLYTVTPRPHT